MNVLSVEKVAKRFGPRQLFKDISFGLEKGQKTAIVARNGTGKSTLLKCIAGVETPDEGIITFNKGLRTGYLDQNVHMLATHRLVVEMLDQDDPVTNAVRAYEHAVARHADDATMERVINEMTELGAWDHEAHVQVLLHRFGLRDMEQPVNTLSGQGQAHGFVFNECTLDGESPEASVYLGRPWRDYAQTVFLNCTMSNVVKPEGWHNWDKVHAEKTTFYAEYGSKGAGAIASKRVAWSKQLTEIEAQKYTIGKVLAGKDNWNPQGPLLTFGLTNVPDTSFNVPKAFSQLQKQYPNASKVSFPLPISVAEERNVTYCSVGTRNLQLDVYYPKSKSKKPRPAVLVIHGGGWRSGDRGQSSIIY